MTEKEVRAVCPCCESLLDIDVLTGRILKWRRKPVLNEEGKPVVDEGDWISANERVSRRSSEAADQLERSLQREKTRARDLDDLFEQANEKLRRKEEP